MYSVFFKDLIAIANTNSILETITEFDKDVIPSNIG